MCETCLVSASQPPIERETNLVKKYFLNPSSWQLLHTVGQDMDACSRRQRDVKCPPEDYFPRQTFLWQIKEPLAPADTNIANQQQTPPAPAPANIELKPNKLKYLVLSFTSPFPPPPPPNTLSSASCDKLYQGTSRCFYTLDESLWSKSGEDERKLVIFQIVELTVPHCCGSHQLVT